MINPGTYTAVCIGYKWGTTKGGKEQIACQFQVLEGEEAGQTVVWYGYFTHKTWHRTCEALRFMGWKGDDLGDLGELDYKVSIVVEHETYEGKTRAKVQWVNRLGGGIVLNNPMTDRELQTFAAKMRAHARKIPEVDGEPGTPENGKGGYRPGEDEADLGPDLGGPEFDDDVPF